MKKSLAELESGVMYLAFGKPDIRKEDEVGSKILVAFVKKLGKFHGLRVVAKEYNGWELKAIMDFYVDRMREFLWKTYYPKRKNSLPVEKLKFRVELDDFELAKDTKVDKEGLHPFFIG